MLKLAFHGADIDTDTDTDTDILATILVRMSVTVSVSWNTSFTGLYITRKAYRLPLIKHNNAKCNQTFK